MKENYICNGDKFTYRNGYIMFPVEMGDLPETINIEGVAFLRKSDFHVSLFCIKKLTETYPDIEQKAIDFFCSFIQENDISFVKYTGEFRLAKNGEKKPVVALCEISNLKEFFEAFGKELGIVLPQQPTHVTTYTLKKDEGIGLNSPEEMENNSSAVQVPNEVKEGLGLI